MGLPACVASLEAGLATRAAPLLELAQLHGDVSVASMFRRAPVIEALELDGLRLHVARTAEGHDDIDDIDDLVARLTPPADAPASQTPHFALDNL